MTPMLLFRLFFAVTTILMQHFVSPYYAYYDQGCGISSVPYRRIVGGILSYPNQWPWLAAIIISGTGFNCGGSVISTRHILTAAHCAFYSNSNTRIPTNQLVVKLGDCAIDSNTSPYHAYHYVSGVFVHNGFRKNINDIAILKLKMPIQFNIAIQPICLPTVGMVNQQFLNEDVVVAGWGSLQEGVNPAKLFLHHVLLKVVTNNYCQTVNPGIVLSKSMICAGYTPGGKGACQGDSGGPLMITINKQWFEIGLVSGGTRCADPGSVGVYTRVSEFIPWISQTMRY